jgi:heme exporter protein D
MFDLGEHGVFIWLCYAATGFVVSALLLWVFADERAQRRRLAELEERGIRRRSASQTEQSR